MNMGERLKELRLKKGATQEEVGKIINVTKPTIMKYEKGLVENLKRSSIEKLAKYFDVVYQKFLKSWYSAMFKLNNL